MWDGKSASIISHAKQEELLKNKLLKFKTGRFETEENSVIGYNTWYHSLQIKLNLELGITRIQGSLHTFYNSLHGKKHNSDDFTMSKLRYAINHIENKLGLDPTEIRLHSLEAGFNPTLWMDFEPILDCMIGFKNRPFRTMSKRSRQPILGVDCYLTEYGIKMYKKRDSPDNSCRIEDKFLRMRCFRKEHLYLSDLLNRDIWYLAFNHLMESIDNMVLVEPLVSKIYGEDLKVYKDFENPRKWKTLNVATKRKRKLQIEKINEAHGKYQIKRNLKKILTEKFHELLNN